MEYTVTGAYIVVVLSYFRTCIVAAVAPAAWYHDIMTCNSEMIEKRS